jgi:dienelactone hydrolase
LIGARRRRPKRAAAAVALVAIVALTALGSSTVAAAGEPRASSSALGTYAVGVVEKTFVDRSRPTPPNQSFAGAPERRLLTAIYYPATGPAGSAVVADGATPDRTGAPYPVVILSHGHNSFGREYEPLIAQWVSAGYVVVAPDYPLARKSAPGGATAADLPNQPADASFVLDRALRLSRTKPSALYRMMDRRRVGATGHSLGALTTYSLVYRPCCADRRIDAAAVMAGVAGSPPEFFAGIRTPLLALHGEGDATVPFRAGMEAYARASPPKYFVALIGGQHTAPFRGATDAIATAATRSTLDFFDRYLKDDPDGLARLRRDADVAGIAVLQEEG